MGNLQRRMGNLQRRPAIPIQWRIPTSLSFLVLLYHQRQINKKKDKMLTNQIKFLTWNIWGLGPDMEKRMHKISETIDHEHPDVIALQEVTADVYEILKLESWFSSYISNPPLEQKEFNLLFCKKSASGRRIKDIQYIPLKNSQMERGYLSTTIYLSIPSFAEEISFEIITSHLESTGEFKDTRCSQLREILAQLSKNNASDVIFLGDTNLNGNEGDGIINQFMFNDIWPSIHGFQNPGYTRDSVRNPTNLPPGISDYRLRLDRCYRY